MQLSLHTDFGLRVLILLGASGQQMTIDEIARRYAISRNHLAKVVQALQAQGLIETQRGRGGGLRLAHDPAQISIGQVVRQLERTDSFVSCMGSGADCSIEGACRLKPALAGALEAFMAHLDQFTLADILAQRRQLHAGPLHHQACWWSGHR